MFTVARVSVGITSPRLNFRRNMWDCHVDARNIKIMWCLFWMGFAIFAPGRLWTNIKDLTFVKFVQVLSIKVNKRMKNLKNVKKSLKMSPNTAKVNIFHNNAQANWSVTKVVMPSNAKGWNNIFTYHNSQENNFKKEYFQIMMTNAPYAASRLI